MQKIKQSFIFSAKEIKNPQALVLTAMFIAINIVLDALNVRIQITPSLRITFGFIVMAMIGMLFGPVMAMTAGAASDILGWLVNNGGGMYFPGFTLTAVLAGLIWGVFLYKEQFVWWRCALAKLCINIFLNICLNSLWMYIYYGKATLIVDLLPRLLKNIVMLPIEVVMLLVVGKIVIGGYYKVKKVQ